MMPRFLLVPLVALALLVGGCSDAPPEEEETPLSVETTTATTIANAEVRRYHGTLRGVHRVPLSTKMTGTIRRMDVEEGDRVEKGQTLVYIRSQNVEAQRRQVQAHLRKALAARDNAETNVERMKALREKDSATEKEFDDAMTAYEQAEAEVDALQAKLAETEDMLTYATIEAPVNGYVVKKRVQTGGLAAPGQPLLVVETLDDLEAVVQVPEQDVNRFSTGDSVVVKIGAASNRVEPGIVTQINPSGHRASRQFEVQVRLQNVSTTEAANGFALKSGMYAQVEHQSGTTPTLTVPEQALVTRGQLTGLYAVSDDRALLRWVRTGTRTDGRVEILSGLRPGERYVTDTTPRISDGQPVRTQ